MVTESNLWASQVALNHIHLHGHVVQAAPVLAGDMEKGARGTPPDFLRSFQLWSLRLPKVDGIGPQHQKMGKKLQSQSKATKKLEVADTNFSGNS